jgi:hypothetical protein
MEFKKKLTATAELVVPRSIPTTLHTSCGLSLLFEDNALGTSLVGAALNLVMDTLCGRPESTGLPSAKPRLYIFADLFHICQCR